MDAERRHELKQNDFAEAITKLREVNWSDPRITYWTVGIALVIVIFVGYRVMQYRAATQVSSAYQALGEVEVTNTALGDAPLDTLQRIIDDNPQPGVVGIATLRLALGKQERDDIEAAQRDYEKIIAMQGTPLAIQAAATYQLGKTYEEQRDFDGARQAYARLTEGSEFIGQPYVEMAKARLDTLSDLAVNVVFESGTRPLEAVEAQPKEQRLFSQPPNLSTLSTAARRPDAEPGEGERGGSRFADRGRGAGPAGDARRGYAGGAETGRTGNGRRACDG